jgi:hypothetical protein
MAGTRLIVGGDVCGLRSVSGLASGDLALGLAVLGGDECCEGDEHPCGGVDERGGGRDESPEQAGDAAGGEVAETLGGGEQAECGAAQVLGGERGDGGVLGGLDAADADASEDERAGKDEDADRGRPCGP